MKRFLALALILMMLFSLCACGRQDKMYIEKAKLTKAEESIVRLLGAAHGSELIYDYKVDKNAKTMQINSYELVDGEWQMISGGGGLAMPDQEGRIALRFEKIGEDLRVAIQCGDDFSATEFRSAEALEENLSHMSASITDQAAIEYEKEIPLAVQIATTKTEIRSFGPEYYFNPEEYAQYGYEHVYAITVMFSTEELG